MHTKVICHYRVKEGQQAAFEALLSRHWPTLHTLGLVTNEPTKKFRGDEGNEKPIYFEIFEWREGAAERAHEHPEVMAIWEPMGQLCEDREGKPSMEFPHVELMDD